MDSRSCVRITASKEGKEEGGGGGGGRRGGENGPGERGESWLQSEKERAESLPSPGGRGRSG